MVLTNQAKAQESTDESTTTSTVTSVQKTTSNGITYTFTPVTSADELISGAKYVIRPLTKSTTVARPVIMHNDADGTAQFVKETDVTLDQIPSIIWTAVAVPDGEMTCSVTTCVKKLSFKSGAYSLVLNKAVAASTNKMSASPSLPSDYAVLTSTLDAADYDNTAVFNLAYPYSSSTAGRYAWCWYNTSLNYYFGTASIAPSATLSTWAEAYTPHYQFYRVTVSDENKKDFYKSDCEATLSLLGDGIHQYTLSNDELLSNAAELKSMIADDGEFDEEKYFTDLTAIASASSSNKTLSMPKVGRFIRVKASPVYACGSLSDIQTYFTSVNGTNGKSTCASDCTTGANEENTIFCYYPDGENTTYGKLCAYASGEFMDASGDFMTFNTTASSNASSAKSVGFAASVNEPSYYIMYYDFSNGNITSGYMPCPVASGSEVSRGAGLPANITSVYWPNCDVEYVEKLPVTIDEDGFTTFEAPVAVSLADDCSEAEIYVASIANKTMSLSKAQNGVTYAAGTGFLIHGTASQKIHFDIHYDATVVCSDYVDAFRTHRATKAHEAVEGKTTFIVTAATASTSASAPRRRVESTSEAVPSITFTALTDGEDVPPYVAMLDLDSQDNCATFDGDDAAASFSIPLAENTTFDLSAEGGIETSIAAVEAAAEPKAEAVYDLQGRRINAITRPGIYIVNGKKMIY